MEKLLVLIKEDLKNIYKNPMYLISFACPLLLIIFCTIGINFIENNFTMPLSKYYALILWMALIMTPFLIGVLVGLILLDEKDQNLMIYFSVTPLKRINYLIYRLSMPFAISFIMNLILFIATNLIRARMINIFIIVFLTSLLAPITTIFMGAFGENKLQGLTLTKLCSFILFFPAINYFIDSKIKFLTYIIPNYYSLEIIRNNYVDGKILVFSLVINTAWIYLLGRKLVNQ